MIDFENFGLEGIQKYAGNVDTVTMGIKPSNGTIHVGNAVTIQLLLTALDIMPNTKGEIFIEDREFALQDEIRLPNPGTVQALISSVESAIAGSIDFLGDEDLARRVKITKMSDFLAKNGLGFADLVAQTHQDISWAFPQCRLGGMNSITPVCPSCESTRTHFKREPHQWDGSKFTSQCTNPACSVNGYTVDFSAGETNAVVYYCTCCMREVLTTKQKDTSVLHIYGGDYGIPWGAERDRRKQGKGASKVTRIQQMISSMGAKDQVFPVVGPLINVDGQKLAKRKRHTAQVDHEALGRLLHSGQHVIDLTKPQ